MELLFTTRDEELVIEVSGRVDRFAAGRLYDVIVGGIRAGRHQMVVDLSAVSKITRAGARGLIIGARFARCKGVNLKISGASAQVGSDLVSAGFPDLQRAFVTPPEREEGEEPAENWSVAS